VSSRNFDTLPAYKLNRNWSPYGKFPCHQVHTPIPQQRSFTHKFYQSLARTRIQTNPIKKKTPSYPSSPRNRCELRDANPRRVDPPSHPLDRQLASSGTQNPQREFEAGTRQRSPELPLIANSQTHLSQNAPHTVSLSLSLLHFLTS
jgi:hypothetical protein